ncbi:MAG: hypothetical protein QOD99_680, partial [Chthoniobacter sp.]|nr:hypothetical protein [Chthoniobacter sp.]
EGARNELVDLEGLSDDELKKLEAQFSRIRERATNAKTKSAASGAATQAKAELAERGIS